MTEKENTWKEDKRNYVELEERQIFEKIKKDLTPIQENLSEKRITVNEAKSELKKINERLKWTKLEKKDKKEIWNAFEKLIKLEANIDETALKNEVEEIIKIVEKLTKKDLANLKRGIQQKNRRQNPERPAEVQKWINESSDNLIATIHKAAEDENTIARKIWEWMNYLMS